MNHKKVAEGINKAIGEGNIQAAAHCATRLRLVLNDYSKVDQKTLDNLDGVKGTFEANNQFQIIIGAGDVNNVYDELLKLADIKEVTKSKLKETAAREVKSNPVMSFIKILSDIFVPIVPALVAGGLLMALNNILTANDLFGPQSIIEMYPGLTDVASIINLLAAAPFAFLPILVGFSATKRFGGNPYLGAAMGMIMVMPELANGNIVANAIADGSMNYWHIFGLEVAQAGYQGSVLPVLAVSWILANLEKFFHKRIPSAFDFTFTPMLSIIITGFLTFIVVGPVMRVVSDGLTDSLVWLYDTTGAIGLGVFGLLYSPIVITGLHQSFPAIETTLLADVAKTGGSFIFPVASMANVAQGAATLAIVFLTKSQKQKSLATSASVSAMLGITEPAIFGVNLKLKFPFICGMISAAIACVFIGFFRVLAVAMGPASVIGFISIEPKKIPYFMIGIAISLILGFVTTYLYGKKNMNLFNEEVVTSFNNNESVVKGDVLGAVVSGNVVSLQEVSDPIFSKEMIGKGVAIVPTEGVIYAPSDGELTVVYETKHAYGLKTDNGAEVLIHVGVDTVKMKGEGFSTSRKVNEQVKKGDILGTFDIDKIKKKGLDTTVMMIITNTGDFAKVEPIAVKFVQNNDSILSLGATYED